jgi:aminopeptidase-like protein
MMGSLPVADDDSRTATKHPHDVTTHSTSKSLNIGAQMHGWATDLFPICRSITGNGVRQTLAYLSKLMPALTLHEVPSGTRAFDWTVPDEWNVRAAYIEDESGRRIVDFARNNLHLMGYSEPVDRWLTLEELQPHLRSLPAQPFAIPYYTSYYARRWAFCLTQEQRDQLPPGRYHAVVDATLEPGSLTYGELILRGREEKEILLSTYICHPSMANNELSGPVVTTALARWVAAESDRRFTYRILFIPETIGSIVYLSTHLEEMKQNTIAGFVVTCVGDDRAYTLLRSRAGHTLADRVAQVVMKHHAPDYVECSYLDRGSDERQYCSPGVDLPVVSIMRTRYDSYPEYHTSLDDLTLVTPSGLAGGYDAIRKCLELLEHNYVYKATTPCEPQLGKRELYPTESSRGSADAVRGMMNVLAYSDGTRDVVDLAQRIGLDPAEAVSISEQLDAKDLLSRA